MKRFFLISCLLLLTSCEDDNTLNNCNFLFDVGVNFTVNLNLPQFSQLQIPNSPILIQGEGNLGIYVINTGGMYRAFDAADPNHIPEDCSFMERNGLEVTCGCPDENKYLLLTGTSVNEQLPCTLQEYRVTESGNNLIITN